MRFMMSFIMIMLSFSSIAQDSKEPVTKPQLQSPEALVASFEKMHQELMPVVAVADMFYGCNKAAGGEDYSFETLINDMDKEQLATKLTTCLGSDSLASDEALDFGIMACFADMVSDMEEAEQTTRLNQVREVLKELPREQRQSNFTQCVNNQTLKYLPPMPLSPK